MYNNPYYNPMQTYMPTQRFQPLEQPTQTINAQSYVQPVQTINTQSTLLGKMVDSVDVVKAMEYPLDGSTSYFPLTDGSAIVTKKLQADGTTKTTIYKITDEEQKDLPKYITNDDLEKALKDIDMTETIEELKDDFKEFKQEFKDFKKSKKKDE